MHKFLIYLSIYFFMICFELYFIPFSEADVQVRQWFKSSVYGVSTRTLTPYSFDLKAVHLPLKMGYNEARNM
jgi:E3 ubiquitin-protein ligase DOA10